MSRPPQHRRAGYSKAKLRDDFYAVIDGGRLTPLEDKSQVVEAMTEGPFERFTARGSFAFCRPCLLIACFNEACLVAKFVGIPVTDDHLYLWCQRFVGGSWPTCVSLLPKPHHFLQLRQSDCIVVHGIPPRVHPTMGFWAAMMAGYRVLFALKWAPRQSNRLQQSA